MPRDSSDEEEYSYDSEFESLESLSETSEKNTVEERKAQEETIDYEESFISFETECENDVEETKACGSIHEEIAPSPLKRQSAIEVVKRRNSTLPLHEICNNVEDQELANRSTKERKNFSKPIEIKEQAQSVLLSRKSNLESSREIKEPLSNESKEDKNEVQNPPPSPSRKSLLSSRPSLGPRMSKAKRISIDVSTSLPQPPPEIRPSSRGKVSSRIQAFIERQEANEIARRKKMETRRLEAEYNSKVDIDKNQCQKCKNVQSYIEFVNNRNSCSLCHGHYMRRSGFDLEHFEQRMFTSRVRKEQTMNRIRNERLSTLHNSKSLKREELDKTALKADGNSFLKRMQQDLLRRTQRMEILRERHSRL